MFSIPLFIGCKKGKKEPEVVAQVVEQESPKKEVPFVWEGANVYFLLTDRFNNGNPDNDINFDRTEETGVLRGF